MQNKYLKKTIRNFEHQKIPPMHLIFDIGNTQIKIAVFEQNKFRELFTSNQNELLTTVNTICIKYSNIEKAIMASSGTIKNEVLLALKKKLDILQLTAKSNFPFTNAYSTPDTLGIDRMVLAAGAVLQYPKQNRLIIDLGTCITYDFVDDTNKYHGGAISPGIRLRYESMFQQTAKLPLLTKKLPTSFIGNSTHESIHSGVINGVILEIDGFIDLYKSQYAKFITILTGGDSDFLAMQLKNTIFANSNFLLESLNQTYQYNQNDKK